MRQYAFVPALLKNAVDGVVDLADLGQNQLMLIAIQLGSNIDQSTGIDSVIRRIKYASLRQAAPSRLDSN